MIVFIASTALHRRFQHTGMALDCRDEFEIHRRRATKPSCWLGPCTCVGGQAEFFEYPRWGLSGPRPWACRAAWSPSNARRGPDVGATRTRQARQGLGREQTKGNGIRVEVDEAEGAGAGDALEICSVVDEVSAGSCHARRGRRGLGMWGIGVWQRRPKAGWQDWPGSPGSLARGVEDRAVCCQSTL